MSQKMKTQEDRIRAEAQPAADSKVQGEGDYDASHRYRRHVEAFLEKADVEQLAKAAVPKSALEARELALAQERGESRTKGDDPADVGAMYPGQPNTDES
jgi:hypothetical protein